MKKQLTLSALLIVLFATFVFAQVATSSIEGNWSGAIETGGIKLRLVFKVSKTATGFQAKFDSVDQGATDLDVDTVTVEDRLVKFEAKKYGFRYEGKLNDQCDEMNGVLYQGPASLPLVLKRVADLPTINRPQDPKKPYPYDEEEVSYRNEKDNIKLAGTLTLPRGGGSHPAVVLITGSGAQDRNETIAGHRPFLVLADHLTRNGIAVLRVDDRGVGGSEAGSPIATSENYAGDVLAGVQFLKTRKEINPKKIGLIGHSEGGMIAPIAAARSTDVAFIVLLAGAGQRGEDVIYSQTESIQKAMGTDPEVITQANALQKRIHAIVKAQEDGKRIGELVNEDVTRFVAGLNESQRKAFVPIESTIKALSPMYQTAWFRYFIMFDPTPVLKKVTVPVLALNGEQDLQVPWKENLDLIAAALKAGNNKDFTTKSFPKLNHLFQTSQTGALSEYGKIEETMSPEVLNTISEWILKRTK
jgi:pimeloyl-ACP methyl ester carboxylesterase